MARVLILGKNGQVSTYLQRDLAASHEVVVAGREIMDLANPEKVYDALKEISPEIIINAAAYTAVDAAETDCETAFAKNRDSVTEKAR